MSSDDNDDNASRALRCALEFRELGLTPLPSIAELKRPAIRYSHVYDRQPVDPRVYQAERWIWSGVQLIAGNDHPGRRSIVVVDLDGEGSASTWSSICLDHGHDGDRTWVAQSGGGGLHVYYGLRDRAAHVPSGRLWGAWDVGGGADGRGDWEKHREVRLVADRSLIMTPPSLHQSGRRYQFLAGRSPRDIEFPEPAPAWLLAMPRLDRLLGRKEFKQFKEVQLGPREKGDIGPNRDEVDRVNRAVRDKLALVRSWGLDVVHDRPNARGWVNCYVPWRECRELARTPSGSFQVSDGLCVDMRDRLAMPFFKLGAILQPASFPTWRECYRWCAARYG